VLHLAALVPGERQHCEQIAELALQLFEGIRHLTGLSAEAEEWLEAAALLQNVGLVISHDRHHLHSYYVIRNSELLTGFTEHELEIIALVARYHRKSTPKARHLEYAGLPEADQRVVEILSGVLRIAAGLDRTRAGAIGRLRVEGGPGTRLRILVETAPGADADLELYSARNRKDLLEAALGVTVDIEAVPPGLLRVAPAGAAG
jgi:exopolyphosphatase/guanosine-5'-triphosphate,3'-diphosphate pyrophosphatase